MVVLLTAPACGIFGGCLNCRKVVTVENTSEATVTYWYDDAPRVTKMLRPAERNGDIWNIPYDATRRTLRANDDTGRLIFCQSYSSKDVDTLHLTVRIVSGSLSCP